MAAKSAAGTQEPENSEERVAVLEQLERLLANPHFSNSRRFPLFLRFIVERTLSGQADLLKERTIGIEIFRREPDYDTASDPIVRVTATEIRKRLAQYYQDSGHENELRLSLPTGAYVPQFQDPRTLGGEGSISAPATISAGEWAHGAAQKASTERVFSLKAVLGLAIVAAILGAACALGWQFGQRTSSSDSFWAPVLNGKDPVLLCIADQNQYSEIAMRDTTDPSRLISLRDHLTAVVIDDIRPAVRIGGILQASGKKYSLLAADTTSLTDLRSGPTIFVGAFDNSWTLRLTKGLRYRFANNADMSEFRIVDAENPDQNRWLVNRQQQMTTNNFRDFAIIAQFTDPTTGKLAIVVAGVGRGGTIAAGEFLTDSANLSQLQRIMQNAGGKKNMELVLSTQVIDGDSGTPKVEATYFW